MLSRLVCSADPHDPSGPAGSHSRFKASGYNATLAQRAGGNMLLGLDLVLSPDLLHALAAMGHGDRLALVDANYPATRGRRLIQLPGVDMPRALQAVLSVFPIDTFIPEPCAVMQVVGEPDAGPPVQPEMIAVLASHGAKPAASLERHAFYAAAETAYAIVQTGERR